MIYYNIAKSAEAFIRLSAPGVYIVKSGEDTIKTFW